MPVAKKRFSVAMLLLFAALVLRGMFLEYTDLIDPTEARYANVAQEMYLSGNYITPQIHMPEGVVPYLGKPPLHFWITIVFYKIFGMEEWTARIGSFIASLAVIFLMFGFCARYFSKETALVSCLITFSSGMFFFLSGASITDMTLTALVVGAVFFLYNYIRGNFAKLGNLYLAAIFTALSFLTKGPVSLVLIFFPLVLWSLFSKDLSWIKRINWLKPGLLFLLITAPWFILSEIENPGFIKYFVWNENIARYLFKEYGDRYGSGHVYMRGASWIMLFAAFMPWTLILFYKLFRIGFKEAWNNISADKDRLFVACWTLSTPLFFTFVRQLHAMYLLPAIPPFAILTALILDQKPIKWTNDCYKKYAVTSLFVYIILIVTCSILFEYSSGLLWFFVLIYIAGLLAIWRQQLPILNIQVVSSTFVFFITFYFIVIVCYSPYMDNRRSAENILLELSEKYEGGVKIPNIGMISHSAFSHYWTANAWETELKSKILVKFIDPLKIKDSNIDYVLFRDKMHMLPPEVSNEFVLSIDKGTWKLFKRKQLQ